MNILPRHLLVPLLSVALGLGVSGCKSNAPANTNATQGQDQTQAQDQSQDPAIENVAPIPNATQASYQPSSGSYPVESSRERSDRYASNQPDDYNNPDYYNNYDNYDQPVDYAEQAPPPLPQYDQPPCPGDDYMWTPGYWNWASEGYYWVPGAWVHAPYQGALWTPGYWSFRSGRYGWHRGFWGRHVGYYGGIDYGYGYTGYGYQGGYWNGDNFAYNRSVNNVNTTIVRNVYNYTIVNNTRTVTQVSYNGPGGVQAKPRPAEIVALREQHNPPMTAQVQQAQQAQTIRANFAAVNRDRPQVVAAPQPLQADHNIKVPPPVPMRQRTPVANNARNGEPPRPGQPPVQPQPRANEPSQAAPMRTQPAPRQQEPLPQQQHPSPVQHPERQQPAPEYRAPEQRAPEQQAPAQHSQAAPDRQAPQPQRPVQEQRPAPVARPQAAPQHPASAPPEHQQQQRPAAPVAHPQESRPAPNQHANPKATEHKPAPKKKEEKKPE